MKKSNGKKSIVISAILMTVFVLCLTACGSSSGQTSAYTADQEKNAVTADAASASDSTAAENRKKIKDVSISAQTEEFTRTDKAIRDAADEAGGYVEYSSLDNYGSARSESLTLRIPAERLDAFLETVGNNCSIIQKSEQIEDITDAYNETESELNSLKTELDSLNAMLEKAETVEDAISIQDRISDVRARISVLESQKKSYDSQIAYSTVNLSLREAQIAIGSTQTAGERISYGFRSTLHAIGVFFVELFIFLVSASPVLLILAAIVFLILFLVKRADRRNAKKRNRTAPCGYPAGNIQNFMPYGQNGAVPPVPNGNNIPPVQNNNVSPAQNGNQEK